MHHFREICSLTSFWIMTVPEWFSKHPVCKQPFWYLVFIRRFFCCLVSTKKISGFAWWNSDIISVCGNCLSQLPRSWGTGSERNLIAQLVSRLSLSEIMFQGRTNIGQLVSQLSLSEKYGSGRTMGTSRVLIYVSISVLLSLLGEWRGFEMQFLKQYLLGLCYEWEVFWLVPGGVCRMLPQLCHVLWLCVCGLPGVCVWVAWCVCGLPGVCVGCLVCVCVAWCVCGLPGVCVGCLVCLSCLLAEACQ